jgi:hypothetical protein
LTILFAALCMFARGGNFRPRDHDGEGKRGVGEGWTVAWRGGGPGYLSGVGDGESAARIDLLDEALGKGGLFDRLVSQ